MCKFYYCLQVRIFIVHSKYTNFKVFEVEFRGDKECEGMSASGYVLSDSGYGLFRGKFIRCL